MVRLKCPPWHRRRRYLHFDRPLGLRSAVRIATNPDSVARHSFYPLIHAEISSVKLERDPSTRIVRRKLKQRPIAYAAHADSQIYAYYAHLLNERYEEVLASTGLADCVLAFRSLRKSNIDFAKGVFDDILRRQNCEVMVLDITGFFDNLDHGLLKQAWQSVLNCDRLPADHFAIYKSLARWNHVEKGVLYKTLGISVHNPKKDGRRRLCEPEVFRELVRPLVKRNPNCRGIPQGTPISAVLSNIYLFDFDAKLNKMALELDARYFRYCDDMVVVSPLGQLDRLEAAIKSGIAESKLEIHPDKTTKRHFCLKDGRVVSRTGEPLQYLGFEFDGKNTRIRFSSVARYCDRMERGIWIARKTSQRLNGIRLAKNRSPRPLYLKKIYRRYGYVGRRNFMSYAYRAARDMNAPSIKRQLKPMIKKFRLSIQK